VDAPDPQVSVIITTYNRGDLVRRQLHHLTRQDVAAGVFEVIVSDDGSSDDTRSIVDSFAGRLPVAYHFQEDLGFRANHARNAGARLARGQVLVFLDAGALPGPGFVAAHLAAHADPAVRRAVVGYGHGFGANLANIAGLDDAIDRLPTLAAVAERFAGHPEFRDGRYDRMAAVGFVMDRDPLPWQLFFTFNCSVRAADFWSIGAFDETFVQWGGEDLEIGYRMARAGLSFVFSQDAWVVEWPHGREMGDRMRTFYENMLIFLAKFTEPAVELGVLAIRDTRFWEWPDWYVEVQAEADRVRTLNVCRQIEAAPYGGRVAVFGCGPQVPADLAGGAILCDFDAAMVDAATRDGRHSGRHAIGLRTTLPDQSVDRVLITSRLAGLWPRWGAEILAEARRIGRKVEVLHDVDASVNLSTAGEAGNE